MQLRITDYHEVSPWRWDLQEDAGNLLADHEVNLDTDAQGRDQRRCLGNSAQRQIAPVRQTQEWAHRGQGHQPPWG